MCSQRWVRKDFYQGLDMAKRELSHCEDIHGHPIKFYNQEFSGKVYQVPQFISRVDCDRAKGWQIRRIRKLEPKLNKFFADQEGADIGFSLALAVQALRVHLSKIRPTVTLPFNLKERKRGLRRTGYAGIRLDWSRRLGRNVYQLSVYSGLGEYSAETSKSFYVGTEHTINQDDLDDAMVKAIEWRRLQIQRWMAAHQDELPDNIKIKPSKFKVTVEQALSLLEKEKVRTKKQLKQRDTEAA
jgi:hypothetical protein